MLKTISGVVFKFFSPKNYIIAQPVGFSVLRQRNEMSSSTIEEKRQKLDRMKIGTHSGSFHCDEALACSMLKHLPEYSDAKIIRSREADKLAECDILVDVGGVFDPSKHRYDHHQRTFNESMKSLCPEKKWSTKLSSAGLVYFHFGHRILAKILDVDVGSQVVSVLYDIVYESFIEAVDAIDNGIDISSEPPRYAMNSDLSSRVAYLNPHWNDPEGNKDENLDKLFEKAVELTGSEFVERVKYYGDVWWPARVVVEEALNNRFQFDRSGEIIVLNQGSCPWKEHLRMLERELTIEPNIKYVLYPDSSGMWRVQCVPASKNSFENRLSLPQEWRGLRDAELCRVSGIDGSTFVHASGFIGGNKTMEGAVEMAKKSLLIGNSPD